MLKYIQDSVPFISNHPSEFTMALIRILSALPSSADGYLILGPTLFARGWIE